jgi:hypothetical protein
MSRWKRGQSGNIEGRPRGSRNRSTAEIKKLLADEVPFDRLIAKLASMALQGNVRAADLLLAYRYGKPTGFETIDHIGGVLHEEIVRMAEEEITRLKNSTTEELSSALVARLKLSSVGVEFKDGSSREFGP